MNPLLLALVTFQFECADNFDQKIYVEVSIENEQSYEVKLRDHYFSEMPVHRKELTFKDGELIKIETSAMLELFHITKSENKWSGEYWFDNAQFEINCKETL